MHIAGYGTRSYAGGRAERGDPFGQGIFHRFRNFSQVIGDPLMGLQLALLEAFNLLLKPQLDQADFSKVLSVDQADGQMQQYFQSLGQEDKNRIKDVFAAGEAADRAEGRLADGESPGALQYSRYMLESNKATILEKILALDFINAWNARSQQEAGTASPGRSFSMRGGRSHHEH